MPRITLLFIACILFIGKVCAAHFEYEFRNVKLSDALARMAEDHTEIRLNFIYDELDHCNVSSKIHTDDVQEALKRIVGLNPISVIRKDDCFYIEALQHGKYCYTGKIMDSNSHAIEGATVMLLVPKDSTVLTYGITDAQGRFIVPCDRKEVVGKISCVGHKTLYRKFNVASVGIIILPEIVVALDEIKVKGEAGMLYADRSVYLPTSRQRTAANNAFDLLRRMAIPQINVDVIDDNVTDNTGYDVRIFINGMPASWEELNGMRTSDVKRIEYLENPSNARFQGAQRVVNFIMQLYEYGGYTKFTAWESFLTGLNSRADVYSAFSYKKMNYGFYAGSVNSNTHIGGSNTDEAYRLNDCDIFREEKVEKFRKRHDRYPVTFQTVYNSDKAQVRNTVSFSRVSSYTSEDGIVSWSDSDRQSTSRYDKETPNSSNNFSYSGYQFYSLPRDFSISLEPEFSYSRIHDRYTYALENISISDRFAKEDAYWFSLDGYISKKIRRKHTFSMFMWSSGNFNRINYDGDIDYHDRFHKLYMAYGIKYNMTLNNMYFNLDGGFSQLSSEINKMKLSESMGFTHLNFQYAFDRKNRIGLNFTCANGTYSVSMKSSDVLKMNELLYFTGNPDLSISPNFWADINYNWLCCDKFWLSAIGEFEGAVRNHVYAYEPYEDGHAVIRKIQNDGTFRKEGFGVQFKMNLIDGNLTLQVRPQISFYSISGIYNNNFTAPDFNTNVFYYLGNFYFQASYHMKNKYLSRYIDSIMRTRDFYAVVAGWSNSNWNVRMIGRNFFDKGSLIYETDSNSEYYSSKTSAYGINFCPQINLSVSYTFGYGKKIERNNEVGERGGAASAIIK